MTADAVRASDFGLSTQRSGSQPPAPVVDEVAQRPSRKLRTQQQNGGISTFETVRRMVSPVVRHLCSRERATPELGRPGLAEVVQRSAGAACVVHPRGHQGRHRLAGSADKRPAASWTMAAPLAAPGDGFVPCPDDRALGFRGCQSAVCCFRGRRPSLSSAINPCVLRLGAQRRAGGVTCATTGTTRCASRAVEDHVPRGRPSLRRGNHEREPPDARRPDVDRCQVLEGHQLGHRLEA